jgi:hypothetical protein
MSTFNPDTYCGIYCGACSIAMCGRTGHADEFATCLGGVPRGELVCGGCKSDDVYAGCSTCSLRGCAREKNVEHCIDCADYPCTRYSKWQSLAKFLPRTHESASSLETIRRDGIAHWLDAQKKSWLCPDCGTPFRGTHQYVTNVAAALNSKLTLCPSGKDYLAALYFLWRTGKERGNKSVQQDAKKRLKFLPELHMSGHSEEATTLCLCYIDSVLRREFLHNSVRPHVHHAFQKTEATGM